MTKEGLMGAPIRAGDRTGRRSPRRGCVAATAALLAVPLIAMSSHAASAADPKPPKPKVVKIAAKAFPQLLDRPGTSADVHRSTRAT